VRALVVDVHVALPVTIAFLLVVVVAGRRRRGQLLDRSVERALS
jgi:hypothetical protein